MAGKKIVLSPIKHGKTKLRCHGCRYWWQPKGGDTDEPMLDGECRRHSPVVACTMNVRSGYNVVQTRWPVTMRDDWCGDGESE